jgi:hypothetical protein
MRLTGASPAAIARSLPLDESEVADEIAAALRSLARLQAEEIRHRQTLDYAQLDVMEGQTWAVLRRASGDDARPQDATAMLAAIDRLLRIGVRRDELTEKMSGSQRPLLGGMHAQKRRADLRALLEGSDATV